MAAVGGGTHHGGPNFPHRCEKAELKKAHEAAEAANPDLFKQDEGRSARQDEGSARERHAARSRA
jgi:hypothetical protein